ncbi:hypothetical protein RA307_10245 [Xanthobacteraceae bacterium Astr-EGSB]|uniref:hypothetical protein n=1 Tax=Astrobacterium formosum TaxID=3069710 RepID=UPI0027B150AE|nr:hypothetical protein [Xanthobacteraceae bacterium Astr-EGSB]
MFANIVAKAPARVALGLLIAVLSAALALSGWFAGDISADTASYRVPLVWPDAFAGMRHPLYGIVLSVFGDRLWALALAQTTFHFCAVIVLFREMRRFGLGGAAAFSIAAAALVSQSFLFHGRLALPEVPACSAMLIAFAAALRWTSRPSYGALIACMVFTGLAYAFRPVFLAAMIVVPLMSLLLARLFGYATGWRLPLLAAALALPFLAQSSIRYAALGDFNIVSFGGFQMSGTAGLMIEPQHIERYPDHLRPTAAAVLKARTAAEKAGAVLRTPQNSSGNRSFISAAVGYFDLYARTVDNLVWGPITSLRGDGESWVAFNKRLQAFALATVLIVPDRWAAWVTGATSRFVGRAIVTNAPFVLLSALVILWSVWLALSGARPHDGPHGRDWAAVLIIVSGWIVCAIGIVLLTTLPATRYIDTASMLLPALPLLALITLMRQTKPPALARPSD